MSFLFCPAYQLANKYVATSKPSQPEGLRLQQQQRCLGLRGTLAYRWHEEGEAVAQTSYEWKFQMVLEATY